MIPGPPSGAAPLERQHLGQPPSETSPRGRTGEAPPHTLQRLSTLARSATPVVAAATGVGFVLGFRSSVRPHRRSGQHTRRQRQKLARATAADAATMEKVDEDTATPQEVAPTSGDEAAELDILQFDSAVYFVEEEEGTMKLDVIRMGRMQGTISVDYNTEDGSAVAGMRYESVSGTLTFEPGEVFKTIEIPLIVIEQWDTTLEFKIRLTNPQNCELGRYLYLSRVKVIGPLFFPSRRYQEEMTEYGSTSEGFQKAGISGLDLFYEYCKLNLTVPGIKDKSIGVLIIDQLNNLYFLLTTYVVQYAADSVLGNADPKTLLIPNEKEETLILLAFIYLVPFAVLNLLDIWKAQQKVAEESRAALQQQIFRKFLNFDEISRAGVSSSDLGLSMISDADDIVSSGFMNVFELLKQLGKLLVSLFFIQQENPDTLPPTLLVAVAIAIFIASNYETSADLREEVSDRQARIVDVAQEASGKISLIGDYKVRPLMEDTLAKRIAALNEASLPVSTTQVNNDYFPSWLSNLLVAGYLALGGQAVLDGTTQIGTFLATVNIFKGISDTFKDIFTASLELSKATGPICKLTELLNRKTNLRAQKKINRARRQRTKLERSPDNLAVLRRTSGQRFGTDAILIKLDNLSFAYPNDAPKVKNVSVSCSQGSLVAVCGPRRGGKSTLIKLLGQVLDPTEGEIFMPSYLRILHVSASPIILEGSMWRNLTIGSINYWRDPEFESLRAIKICKRLGLSERFMAILERTRERFLAGEEDEEDDDTKDWRNFLSISDVMLVHLARAFIYNPEILVMNRPTSQLPESLASEVFGMLREFVDNRGIELPKESASKRRPRTAFISFARAGGVLNSDVVWVVDNSTVREAAKEEISALLVA